MNTSLLQPAKAPPYRRWFLWLLAGALVTLIAPYTNSGKSWVYDPEIRTFVETSRGFEPTAEKIHVDGRTFAFINASNWLHVPLAVVVIEAGLWSFLRRRESRRVRSELANPMSSAHERKA